MTAFRQALKDAGYVEGRNVEIYFRSADGQTDRLVTLAGDIVGRRVAVIVTTGGGAAALAAYATTTTIPIVYVAGVDPVFLPRTVVYPMFTTRWYWRRCTSLRSIFGGDCSILSTSSK